MYRCPSIQNESGDTFQICVISCFVLHATFYWIGKLHRRKTCSTCDRNYECNQKRIRSDEDFGWCTAFPFVNVKIPTLNGKNHPEVLAVGLCSSTQIATMLLLYFFFWHVKQVFWLANPTPDSSLERYHFGLSGYSFCIMQAIEGEFRNDASTLSWVKFKCSYVCSSNIIKGLCFDFLLLPFFHKGRL